MKTGRNAKSSGLQDHFLLITNLMRLQSHMACCFSAGRLCRVSGVCRHESALTGSLLADSTDMSVICDVHLDE